MTPDFKSEDAQSKKEIKQKHFTWKRVLLWLVGLGFLGGVAGVLMIAAILAYFSTQIPSVDVLANYKPSLVTKIYDKDGEVLAEYSKERRIWIPVEDIPTALIQAYLAAEDTNFYTHGGYNPKAILRAAITNALTGRKHGASTITQQVAKTYLLSSEKTYKRKIKELLISRRIEKTFSKDKILELYLNRIYLGHGAYGVGSAAQTYFSKTLPELSLGERALLAGLPKAPSRYDPVNNPNRAKLRRDIILRRMETEGFITKQEADTEVAKPIELKLNLTKSGQNAPHFSEYIRREILDEYGKENLYEGGLAIYTTIDSQLQKFAQDAVNKGVVEYDRRHGYRGPIGRMKLLVNWEDRLQNELRKAPYLRQFGLFAIVLEVEDTSAQIGFLDEQNQAQRSTLLLSGAEWAKKYIDVNKMGDDIKSLTQILDKGDIILVERQGDSFALTQYPNVQAALVAIDIATGAIRAMVGGTDSGTGFNRAVQSERQVGSAFKPIIYAKALETGYTPATTVLDAPIIIRENNGTSWKPKNYSSRVYGPSPLRRGLEKSLNLMTIRVAQDIGVPAIKNLAGRLGLPYQNMNNGLAMALGTASFSLLDITNAYSVFPRQGKYLEPHAMTRVQDAAGTTLSTTHPQCHTCLASWSASPFIPPAPVSIETKDAMNEANAYQMVSLLQGVFQRGTARKYNWLGDAVAGKTGTTDNSVDGWFVGFTPNLAVGVWMGFDTPQTTGRWESGGKLTLPIWSDFMKHAQQVLPKDKFKVPSTISLVEVDTDSGKLPGPSTQHTHLEAFTEGTIPTEVTPAPTGGLAPSGQGDVPAFGIY